jgi:uncharacterized protein (DUF1015 family)
MAEIAPFRGILYAPRAGDPGRLLAPPYDVIAEEERLRLEAADPCNVVRLILPRPAPGEPEGSRYGVAAVTLRDWISDGVLARDAVPAIYRYHQVFRAEGTDYTRKGFIARVRLRRFEEGVILPHERTLSGPKLDRLQLMRATHAHFSQIFGLYPDPERASDPLFAALEATPPAIDASTGDGVTQRLWRLTDGAAIHQLAAFMAARKVYIADGHHRYETMLALQAELRAQNPAARSSVDYGVMFFCNMDDPGLVVLPTHRVLRGLPGFARAALLDRVRPWFAIEERPIEGGPVELRAALAAAARSGPAFALLTPGDPRAAILSLRGDADLDAVPALPAHPALRSLDVTVLHSIVLETVLGLSRESQARQDNLGYVKSWEAALAEREAAGVQAVFLMNPTRVAQVKAVADAGEVMPQKSTYFYPKIASGLVMNPIVPDEDVDPA